MHPRRSSFSDMRCIAKPQREIVSTQKLVFGLGMYHYIYRIKVYLVIVLQKLLKTAPRHNRLLLLFKHSCTCNLIVTKPGIDQRNLHCLRVHMGLLFLWHTSIANTEWVSILSCRLMPPHVICVGGACIAHT